MHRLILGLVAIPLFVSCGKKGADFTATMGFYNGPTKTTSFTAKNSKRSRTLSDGEWKLAPQKMTFTVTGVAFLDSSGSGNINTVNNCVVTYDQSKPSLSHLNDCDLPYSAGTFSGIQIQYKTTYQIYFNDTTTGIYSSPSLANHISTSLPTGGADFFPFEDTNDNGQSTQDAKTYFPAPVKIDSTNKPVVSVVFDPTHWLVATVSGGDFTKSLHMDGDPPLAPILGTFGKAENYSTGNSIQSYNSQGTHYWGFLVLYDSNNNPVKLTTHEENDPCRGSIGSVVADSFNSNGMEWGSFGYLGMDSNSIISWTFPSVDPNDNSKITGYRGVFSMKHLTTVGSSATISYKCTASVPTPTSGQNYSSGAPTFTADGTVTTNLLAN